MVCATTTLIVPAGGVCISELSAAADQLVRGTSGHVTLQVAPFGRWAWTSVGRNRPHWTAEADVLQAMRGGHHAQCNGSAWHYLHGLGPSARFSVIKVAAIVGMIIIGVGVLLPIPGLAPAAGPMIANLWNDGGIFPTGFSQTLLSPQIVVFAHVGVELVDVTAGEAANPQGFRLHHPGVHLWHHLRLGVNTAVAHGVSEPLPLANCRPPTIGSPVRR